MQRGLMDMCRAFCHFVCFDFRCSLLRLGDNSRTPTPKNGFLNLSQNNGQKGHTSQPPSHMYISIPPIRPKIPRQSRNGEVQQIYARHKPSASDEGQEKKNEHLP